MPTKTIVRLSRPTRGRIAAVAIAAVIAGFVALWLATGPLAPDRPRPHRAPPARPAPPVRAPTPPPQAFVPVAPADARASNAAVPVAAGPIEAARPFTFRGTAIDRGRARTCLAAAAWYEAGDDPAGERAVAQVVLNRLRHPAFPKSVCGVVLQGAERATGCQFTFTCDGRLSTAPPAAAWARAQAIADKALSGSIDKAVGTATHYHADYVVPYWRGTLDKVAVVGAHDFYRWKGWWGSRAAFAGAGGAAEPIDPRLAALSGEAIDPMTGQPAIGADTAAKTAVTVPGVRAASLGGATVRAADAENGQFVLELPPGLSPDGQLAAAHALCKGRDACQVMGWVRTELMPLSLPVMPVRMRTMAFMYRRSTVLGVDRPYWNCRQIPGRPVKDCLPGTEPYP